MAELVDALDLKSSGHLTVRVQVPLRVLHKIAGKDAGFFGEETSFMTGGIPIVQSSR